MTFLSKAVDSSIRDIVSNLYTPNMGRPAEAPEFLLWLCLLQHLYGDSDRKVIENGPVSITRSGPWVPL